MRRKKPTLWLQQEVEKYADEKDETYNEETTDSYLKKIKEVHPLLIPQIQTIYNALDSLIKKEIIDYVENSRKQTGPAMQRRSKNYFNHFANHLISHILFWGIFKEVAEKNWNTFKKGVYPYNPKSGKRLQLERWLGIQADQNVFLVSDPETNIKWVMKWEETEDDKENEEAVEYRKLEQMGAQCPMRLDGFYMLNFSVLIIEFLQPLDITDSALELARQLLLTQLKYIHTYACYFDLKTDNIRKRASNPPLYFIIDMNLSKQPRPGGGYKRLHYTPLYSSQSMPLVQTTTGWKLNMSTYKHDFIELLYVIHQMIAKRAYETKTYVFDTNSNDNITKRRHLGLLPEDFFADPDAMYENAISDTARGWKAMKAMIEYPLHVLLSRITVEYILNTQELPNFPPPNIHERMFSTLDQEDYAEFMEKTQKSLPIQCQICSSVSSFRCGDCYHDSVFLCSSECAQKHKCN